eukprot:jgi/Chlat1/1041/Chrsp110S01558
MGQEVVAEALAVNHDYTPSKTHQDDETAAAAIAAAAAGPPPAPEEDPVLDAVEALWARAVLSTAAEKLALACAFAADAAQQAEEARAGAGAELARSLSRQRALESRFEALVAARASNDGGNNTAAGNKGQNHAHDVSDEVHEVAVALRESTRALCRNLRDSPNVAENLVKDHAERARLITLVNNALAELEEGKFTSLLQTTRADALARATAQAVMERERAATSAVKALRQQLVDKKAKHEEEVRARQKSLAAKKEELKVLKARTSLEGAYASKESAGSAGCRARVRAAALTQLEEEITSLKAQLAAETQAAGCAGEWLKKRHVAVQEEALRWMGRHEADTLSTDRELEALKLAHQREALKLKDLEERRAKQEAIEEEERIRAEEAAAAAAEHERRTCAAIKIQARYRGYRGRKDYLRKKAALAKGEGKGKKGKGKGAKEKKAAGGKGDKKKPGSPKGKKK